MAEKKVVTTSASAAAATSASKKATARPIGLPLFEKDNYMWMGIGAIVIALGMILMAGGKSSDPNTFDYKSVYSTTRVTIAPILVIIGLLIEIYAIFKRPKPQH